jgi:zinc D-Ala-D-Ala carboxypeptidase
VSRLEFAHVDEMPANTWRWPHFDPRTEWACKGSKRIVIVPAFMDLLEELRQRVGFALPLTSGYRSPAHNRKVSNTGDAGPHTTAMAADIRVHGLQALTVIAAAVQLGFLGIGVQQKGPIHGRYIHVDQARTVPAIWSY